MDAFIVCEPVLQGEPRAQPRTDHVSDNGAVVTRRAFLASGLAVAGTPLWAQDKPAPRVFRVGLLVPVERSANETNLGELRKGLKDLGYNEGQNLHIEYRAGDARADRYPALAAELNALKVDVIVTNGTPATLAA